MGKKQGEAASKGVRKVGKKQSEAASLVLSRNTRHTVSHLRCHTMTHATLPKHTVNYCYYNTRASFTVTSSPTTFCS